MKRIKQVAVLAILVISLGACGDKDKKSEKVTSSKEDKQGIVVAMQQLSEPEEGMDPLYGWGNGTNPIIQSTLVEYDEHFDIQPDLATEYHSSDDGKEWTFKLRTDAKFTDGEPVTAEDVVFTFEQAKEGDSTLDMSNVEKVEAVSPEEVKITLKRPERTFINAVATLGIVPKHAYDSSYGEHPIGSGPYKLSEWKKGEQIILEANPDYYGDKPDIEQVTLVFMDEDSAYAAAQTGDVDVAVVTPFNTSKDIDGMHLEVLETQDNRGMTMPLSPEKGEKTAEGYPIGNNVTSDKAIREALIYGLDREEMAENTVEGFARPAYSENDGTLWNNTEIKIETDRPKARKILSDAGWKEGNDGILEREGQKAEFDMYYVAGDSIREAICNDVSSQAKDLGIKINIKGSNWDEIQTTMFSNAVLMGWGSSNPYTSYLLFHSSNSLNNDFYNPEGFENKTVDGYLDAALVAATQEDMYENFKKAQWDGKTGTSMLADMPWIWLLNIDHLYYVNDNLDIGEQASHIHGASFPVIQNLRKWKWVNNE